MIKGHAEKAEYYLIRESIAGKYEGGRYYIHDQGRWVPDDRSMIFERLIGFDRSEPSDSPYAVGNPDIIDEIRKISYEELVRFIGRKR